MAKVPSGIGTMEAQANLQIAITAAERATEQAQQEKFGGAWADELNREIAIDKRINTPELQALNSTAELEIYGSRGLTYTDPETGAVIADAAHPIKGRIEDIKSNPRFGTKQADRDNAARLYELEVDNLVNDKGFELSQAKVLLDLRESDWDNVNKLAAKFMTEGMDPVDAQFKAQSKYDKIDEKRRELIKEGGAFTIEEYEAVRKGKDLYAPGVPGAPGVPKTPPPAFVATPEQINKTNLLEGLERRLVSAREKMAEHTVKTRFGAAHGLTSRKEMKHLREAYDLILLETIKSRAEVAKEIFGTSEDDFDAATKDQMIRSSIVDEVRAQAATELDDAKLTRYGNAVRWFNSKHLVTKMLIGGGVAVPAVILGGAVGVAGGAVVARGLISGTRMGSLGHSSKKGSEKVLGKLGDKAAEGINAHTNDAVKDGATFGEVASGNNGLFKDEMLDRVKKSDTRRKAGTAALTIAGAVVGPRVAEWLGDVSGNLWDKLPDWVPGADDHQPDGGTKIADAQKKIGKVTDKALDGSKVKPPTTEIPVGGGGPTGGDLVGQELHIAPGSGFEDSIQAQYGLTDAQSLEAFQAMRPHLEGSPGTYLQGADLRIASPGEFEMNKAAQDALRQYLVDNDLS